MSTILTRIQEISINEGITIAALERVIGASKGVLSRAINNGTDIQSKWIQILVENYPRYSTDWLLTGKGNMLRDENKRLNSAPTISTTQTDAMTPLLSLIKEKDEVIRLQAEEIGRLREKIEQMSRGRGHTASDANTPRVANAG